MSRGTLVRVGGDYTHGYIVCSAGGPRLLQFELEQQLCSLPVDPADAEGDHRD